MHKQHKRKTVCEDVEPCSECFRLLVQKKEKKQMKRQTPKFLNWFKRNYTFPDFSKLHAASQDRILDRYERPREYGQSPKAKAKQREYRQKPENKAKMREYAQRPDVKAKNRECCRKRRLRSRMSNENVNYVNADKNSMLYWYPKIKDLDILQPTTEILAIGSDMSHFDFLEHGFSKWIPKLKETARTIGYPLFLRTDQASHKHNWEKAAFVKSEESLVSCLRDTLEFNYLADMMGLNCTAFVFRKYIQMKNLFTAFYGNMPINPEIRFFIKDGKVLCWHWYWVEDAIKKPSRADWKELLNKERESLSEKEIMDLKKAALKVAAVFGDSSWSVDFCKAKNGEWVLIDMALAERSWHPECPLKEMTQQVDFES